MTTRIRHVQAWEALDSRGRPTVAARVSLDVGAAASALAPSGASAGSHESIELRDGGSRRAGYGVRDAVRNVNERIAPALLGLDASDPAGVDDVMAELDGTANFGALGANATLPVSLATAMAAASANGTSLARRLQPDGALLMPMPMVNIVSGGAHAARAVDIQDVLVIPNGAASFSQAIEWCAEVRDAAGALARESGNEGAALVADEGGVALPFESNRAALAFTVEAIRRSGRVPGAEVSLAVDIAATQFFDGERYLLDAEDRSVSAAELIDLVAGWTEEFPLISIEDILAEDAWEDWALAREQLGSRVQLIGDDHFVTNRERLARGIQLQSANSILIKVNQNGLLSRTQAVLEDALESGFSTIVSARSGETEQSWLADLAVGWRAGQIKVGSTHRSERTAKWNRLLELEATEHTEFAGVAGLASFEPTGARG